MIALHGVQKSPSSFQQGVIYVTNTFIFLTILGMALSTALFFVILPLQKIQELDDPCWWLDLGRKWWAFKHRFFLTQSVSVFLAKKCPEGCLSIASKGWDGQDMQSERAVLNLYLLSLPQPLTSQYLCSGIGVLLLIFFGNNHLASPWSKLEISLGGSVHHLIFLCSGLVINLELFTLPTCWRLPHFLWKKKPNNN